MQSTTLQFITLELPLRPTGSLRDRVEAALQQQGHPLRWAITAIAGDAAATEDRSAIVEAVIRHG